MAPEKDFSSLFLKALGRPLQKSVSLSEYSNFRIGGQADYFFEAKTLEELVRAVNISRKYFVRYYVIGGGCNLLFDDEGFRGIIIKNTAKGISLRDERREVEALSGTRLDELVEFCMERSLTGFEFLAGIPGTVGGAVFSNAGAFGRCVGDFLREALLLDVKGKKISVSRDYFAFDYRDSFLKKKQHLLLQAAFALKPGKKEMIKETIAENLRSREERHPPQNTSYAGSYFKNPAFPDGKKVAAAYFLDQVGAKTLKIGGAAVYSLHSNFIVNQENASSGDVRALARELKNRVKERFGIDLEEEVIYLPAISSMP